MTTGYCYHEHETCNASFLCQGKSSENLEKVPRFWEGEGCWRSEITNASNNDYWTRYCYQLFFFSPVLLTNSIIPSLVILEYLRSG